MLSFSLTYKCVQCQALNCFKSPISKSHFEMLLFNILTQKNLPVTLKSSVADLDPDPKDPHHFAGTGSMIFSMDPDP